MERVEAKNRKGILYKIIGSFMTIFLIVAIVVEIILIVLVRNSYYSSVESYMRSQIRYSQEIYLSYLSDYTLSNAILEDRDQFYRSSMFQVQILDNSGKVLLDDLGTNLVGKQISTLDVEAAKMGQAASSVIKPSYDNYNVMAYSAPLKNRNEQVGIIRLVASLEEVDQIIMTSGFVSILMGLLLILFLMFLTRRIASSIVRPINELTGLAEDLAAGRFDKKAEVSTNDEIGQLSQAMNFMIDNVNEKEQLKNEFISSISHELRTPLTSIKGWAVTLSDGQEDPLMKDGLSIIESETERLQHMVEELLDFSRYTNNKVELECHVINVVDLVKTIAKQVNPRVKNNDLEMVLNYEDNELLANVDTNRIKQVLLNVIDNAIKFTEADGVIIINILDRDQEFVIEVIDTGIGIASDEIGLITDKFYKGKHSLSHMGLGLSIAEEIVKLHGGDIVIESIVEEGTKVSMIIPKGDTNES